MSGSMMRLPWQSEVEKRLLSCVGSTDPKKLQGAMIFLLKSATPQVEYCIAEKKFKSAKKLFYLLQKLLTHIHMRRKVVTKEATPRPALIDLVAAILSLLLDLQLLLSRKNQLDFSKKKAAEKILRNIFLFTGNETSYLWDILLQSTEAKSKHYKEVGCAILERIISSSPWQEVDNPEHYLKCLLCLRLWYLKCPKNEHSRVLNLALRVPVPRKLPKWINSQNLQGVPRLAKKSHHKAFVEPFLKHMDQEVADLVCNVLSEDLQDYIKTEIEAPDEAMVDLLDSVHTVPENTNDKNSFFMIDKTGSKNSSGNPDNKDDSSNVLAEIEEALADFPQLSHEEKSGKKNTQGDLVTEDERLKTLILKPRVFISKEVSSEPEEDVNPNDISGNRPSKAVRKFNRTVRQLELKETITPRKDSLEFSSNKLGSSKKKSGKKRREVSNSPVCDLHVSDDSNDIFFNNLARQSSSLLTDTFISTDRPLQKIDLTLEADTESDKDNVEVNIKKRKTAKIRKIQNEEEIWPEKKISGKVLEKTRSTSKYKTESTADLNLTPINKEQDVHFLFQATQPNPETVVCNKKLGRTTSLDFSDNNDISISVDVSCQTHLSSENDTDSNGNEKYLFPRQDLLTPEKVRKQENQFEELSRDLPVQSEEDTMDGNQKPDQHNLHMFTPKTEIVELSDEFQSPNTTPETTPDVTRDGFEPEVQNRFRNSEKNLLSTSPVKKRLAVESPKKINKSPSKSEKSFSQGKASQTAREVDELHLDTDSSEGEFYVSSLVKRKSSIDSPGSKKSPLKERGSFSECKKRGTLKETEDNFVHLDEATKDNEISIQLVKPPECNLKVLKLRKYSPNKSTKDDRSMNEEENVESEHLFLESDSTVNDFSPLRPLNFLGLKKNLEIPMDENNLKKFESAGADVSVEHLETIYNSKSKPNFRVKDATLENCAVILDSESSLKENKSVNGKLVNDQENTNYNTKDLPKVGESPRKGKHSSIVKDFLTSENVSPTSERKSPNKHSTEQPRETRKCISSGSPNETDCNVSPKPYSLRNRKETLALNQTERSRYSPEMGNSNVLEIQPNLLKSPVKNTSEKAGLGEMESDPLFTTSPVRRNRRNKELEDYNTQFDLFMKKFEEPGVETKRLASPNSSGKHKSLSGKEISIPDVPASSLKDLPLRKMGKFYLEDSELSSTETLPNASPPHLSDSDLEISLKAGSSFTRATPTQPNRKYKQVSQSIKSYQSASTDRFVVSSDSDSEKVSNIKETRKISLTPAKKVAAQKTGVTVYETVSSSGESTDNFLGNNVKKKKSPLFKKVELDLSDSESDISMVVLRNGRSLRPSSRLPSPTLLEKFISKDTETVKINSRNTNAKQNSTSTSQVLQNKGDSPFKNPILNSRYENSSRKSQNMATESDSMRLSESGSEASSQKLTPTSDAFVQTMLESRHFDTMTPTIESQNKRRSTLTRSANIKKQKPLEVTSLKKQGLVNLTLKTRASSGTTTSSTRNIVQGLISPSKNTSPISMPSTSKLRKGQGALSRNSEPMATRSSPNKSASYSFRPRANTPKKLDV